MATRFASHDRISPIPIMPPKKAKNANAPGSPRRRVPLVVRPARPVSGGFGRKGRRPFSEAEERRNFVVSLISSRLSYPEIAKLVAQKFHLTLQGAYLYLARLNRAAADELKEFSDEDLQACFQRLVLSLEDSIMRSKIGKDYKTAIAGEMALSRIYGFDKGTFLAALQEKRKAERTAKHVDLIDDSRALLARDMHSLSVQQLQNLLAEEQTADLLGEGQSGEIVLRKKDKATAEDDLLAEQEDSKS